VFEAAVAIGQVYTFVNYGGAFALHNSEMSALMSPFWKQLNCIQPESYIADSDLLLTFVSRDEAIFTAVRDALRHE
jgi:hypothetical protein